MISNEVFMALFVIIILIYSLRFRFVSFLDDKFYIIVKPQIIGYIMGMLLFALTIFGVFFNEGPGQLSSGFGSLEPKTNQRPHKYFDINTYDDQNQRSFTDKHSN